MEGDFHSEFRAWLKAIAAINGGRLVYCFASWNDGRLDGEENCHNRLWINELGVIRGVAQSG